VQLPEVSLAWHESSEVELGLDATGDELGLDATGDELGLDTTGDELGLDTSADELGLEMAEGAAEDGLGELLPPLGVKVGNLESSSRLQPVRATSSAGHCTCSKVKVGLSAFLNQSKRHWQPGLRASGKESHSLRDEIPPYCAPGRPPNWDEQPLKIPTPPPGMARSKWLLPRSPPVLVDWTTMVLPATGPEVKVRLAVG
jgi:hypothetical protein